MLTHVRSPPPTTTAADLVTDALEPPAPFHTAVLFLIFNRPEATAQVFDAISIARPTRLYVSGDGPRVEREGEAEIVAEVRKIATAVDWPCEIKTFFRDQNLGCKNAVSSGITWFFEHEEQGIVLEDDCLPSQSFFRFCEEMLKRYREDESIMAITGTNITKHLNFNADYFFSKYALMWGWATWRRAWDNYDPHLADWANLRASGWLESLDIGGLPFKLTWRRIFDQMLRGEIDTWDYQWIYSCWVCNGLTVAPARNLIRNLGFCDDATHTFGNDPYRSNLTREEMKFPLKHPMGRELNRHADAFISRHWFHATWLGLVKYFILRIPGAQSINKIRRRLLK